MKILHYTIGFHPERTGGLVSYATDLMLTQKKQGHKVYALYPSNQLIFRKAPKILKGNRKKDITTFRLVNSLPLALFGGINTPEDFIKPCDPEIFRVFLLNLEPDIIHIHSFIGLHKEFLEIAKSLNIKIVYTTHDYYGLAPLPHFYYNRISFDEDNTNLSWNIMSADALSTRKLRIFQSSLYPLIRKVLKKLNRNPKHKSYQSIGSIIDKVDYKLLKEYYNKMFSLVDWFHFNSNLSREVFEANLSFELNGEVISITNSKIRKHAIQKSERSKKVIAYIGPDEEYKGYFDFLNFAETVDREKYDIVTYGHILNDMAPLFLKQKGRFSPAEIDKVYQTIDILVVPSRWKESFGLIVLEALSYDVTVYVSENVGSKDLLPKEYVFSTIEKLPSMLENYTPLKIDEIKEMSEHTQEIIGVYKNLIDDKGEII